VYATKREGIPEELCITFLCWLLGAIPTG